ncbi:anti-sigma factor [Streptomyces sp. NRRL S-87]|uniref:anti-sigma factor family protein n=1 Tax=Streptomyces sp. NRRL S-87 TaxID=1463920 RepID=UPI0004BF490B|nr:zf-HC2 domain-containing protein [Streptomyces sp. NRRL S-87]
MTSTTGTIRHPDVSEISDLTEGLLSPARTAEVRTHLAECPLCADVRASLDEIRGLLGTLPGPQRMPSDIAGRIDAALAAEALLNATSPEAPAPERAAAETSAATTADVSRETSLSRPRTPRSARPAGRPQGGTGPGRTRSRRRLGVLTAVGAAAAFAVTILLVQTLTVNGNDEAGSNRASDTATSAAAFTAAGLGGDVQRLLGDGPEASAKSAKPPADMPGADTYSSEASPQTATGRLTGVTVPACVKGGTGRTEAPLAAERGIFEGRDAYLVVLPHKGDAGRADAYVVDAACESSDPTGRGTVLLSGTYPRG